jgi:hypothetical protein
VRAFDGFFLWGIYLRGAVDVLTFAAAVWALCAMLASNNQRQQKPGVVNAL